MWYFPVQQIAKEAAYAPYVHLVAVLLVPLHLWSNEHRRAILGDHGKTVILCLLANVEINYLK